MQDMYKARSPLYDSDSALAIRMQAVNKLSRLLQRVVCPTEGADPDQRELCKQARSTSFRMTSFNCQHRPWSRAKSNKVLTICTEVIRIP